MKKDSPTEIKDDRYYALKVVKELYSVAMGSYFDQHSANGKFFTSKEFEQNKGKILTLTGAKRKADELINKIPRV